MIAVREYVIKVIFFKTKRMERHPSLCEPRPRPKEV